MLPVLATSLTLLVHLCHATHSTCSWQPWSDGPVNHRYYLWCRAQFHELGPGQGQYICTGFNTTVADWGVLRPGVLEFATPCAKGGFAVDGITGGCAAQAWSLCVGSSCLSPTPNCFWMLSHDDCEWPTQFDGKSRPDSIEVWAVVGDVEV